MHHSTLLRTLTWLFIVLILLLVIIGAGVPTVNAQVVQCTTVCYVSTTGNNLNGGTSPADAKLTIQAGINQVSSGGEVIVAAGTYVEHIAIRKPLTLSGAGAGLTIIDGNALGRPVLVELEGAVLIRGVTIRNGVGPLGGGVYNNFADLTIVGSTISGNIARRGGGIYSDTSTGSLTVFESTISGNSTAANLTNAGAGIFTENETTLINVTISGNITAAGGQGGGGIYNEGTLNATFVTIANNSGTTGGGIFIAAGATTQIKESIIANSTTGGNCAGTGTFTNLGTNQSTDATCTGFTQVTSIQLGLAALGGGHPQVHLITNTSSAFDVASNCNAIGGGAVATDQRGVTRPSSSACDIGAVEVDVPTAEITVTKTANTPSIPAPGALMTFTVTIENTGDLDVEVLSLVDTSFGNKNNSCVGGLPQTISTGETITCTFSQFISGSSGNVINSDITADGDLDDDSDDAPVTIVAAQAGITVTKTAGVNSINEPGGNVTFSIQVTNNANSQHNVTITSITDDIYGNVTAIGGSTCATGSVLTPGSSYNCQFTANVSGATGSTHTNTVTVNAVYGNQTPTSDSDDASVTITDIGASITVFHTANPTSMDVPGGVVAFSVSVVNSSSVDLVTVNTVTHQGVDISGLCNHPVPKTLSIGESLNCSVNVNVTGDAGTQTFGASANAQSDDGQPLSGSANADVTLNPIIDPPPDPPTCTDPNPARDLRHGGSHLNPPFNTGVIQNLSSVCSYDVGLASYEVFDDTVATQRLFSSNTRTIGPNETLNLTVGIPGCATQVDLFYGGVITDFSGGARYGERLLDFRWLNRGSNCSRGEAESD